MANPASSSAAASRQRHDACARQDPLGRHLVAKQHAGAHLLGPPQRPQREHQRHQQAVGGGGEHAAHADRQVGLDRQRIAQHVGQRHRDEKAEPYADDDADARDQQHLHEMHAEDHAAGGAEALEDGDHLAAPIDVGGDRVGHADASDQQRGQADQRQELAQPVERARHLRRRIAAVADGETTLGQRLLGALGEVDETAVGLARALAELQRVAPADQAAGIDQAGAAQRVERDEHARADRQAIGDLVGLGHDGGGDRHLDLAERDLVADLEAEPIEQDAVHGGTGPAPDRLAEVRAVRKRHRADQRIGGIDAFHLDQCLLAAVRTPRHGAHGRHFADAPLLPEPIALEALCRLVRTGQRHVAAEQRLTLPLEAGAQRIGERADAGDDGHAQRHAGDEDVETAAGRCAARAAPA